MSVHIDEVEGKVEPDPAPQSESSGSAPPAGDTDPYKLRMEIVRLAHRSARLHAD
ncbi:MAG: hypothetical protein SGI92_05255 [Bryobacteraceae bacterium]|nr:hypothetical protein [Bryobacteraceae bacterium]